MILSSQPVKKPAEIQVTPLINIVFLMLIFFMLAGSLKPTEVIDPVTGVSAEPHSSTDSSSTITILKDGSLLLGERVVSEDELLSALTASNKPISLPLIKPDGGLEATRLIEIMRLLRQSGFSNVKLLSVSDNSQR